MAYLDSQKNKAMWEIRLESLRKQRADRAAGKLPVQKPTEGPVRDESCRKKITYQELLKREAAQVSKKTKRPAAAMQRETQMEKQAERKSL